MSVAAIVPAHNEEEHIEQVLKSLLGQSYKIDQIVVVCDRCTDDTISIVRRYHNDKRNNVQIVAKEHTRYKSRISGYHQAEAINTGLDNMDFDPTYVLLLDGDTTIGENYVAECVHTLDHYKKCGLVGFSKKKTNIILDWVWGGGGHSKHQPHLQVLDEYPFGSGMFVRYDIIKDVGGYIIEGGALDAILQKIILSMGYEIRSVKKSELILLRKAGRDDFFDSIVYSFGHGYGAYRMHYGILHVLWHMGIRIKLGRMSVIGSLLGYLYAALTRADKIDKIDKHLIKKLEKTEIDKLLTKILGRKRLRYT